MDEVKLSLCSFLERLLNVISMIRLKLCIMLLLPISGRSRTSGITLGSWKHRDR